MATVELTLDNFESTINDNDTVFVDFWAEWCGPCRTFAPTFQTVSEENDDIVFGKVDTEAQQQLAASFGIRSIPTLMVFRDNVLLYNEAGALPPAALESLIEQVKALDMDDVRRQIQEQEQEQADHEHSA